jgi:hypothetical protein
MGDVVEQAGPVAAVDLHHGMGVAGLVVDDHPGLDPEGVQAGREGRPALGQLVIGPHVAGHAAGDQGRQPGQLVRRLQRAAGGRVLDREDVQRHAVGEGEDLRLDDIGAGHRQGAGQPGEQARVVGRVDGDLGGRAVRIDPRLDHQRAFVLPGFANDVGVIDMGVQVKGQPVGVIALRQEGFDIGRRPVRQGSAHRLLRHGDAVLAAQSFEPAGHAHHGAVEQLAQQAAFPGRPSSRTDGADIGHRQDIEQPQLLGGIDDIDQVLNGLVVFDVPPEGQAAEIQVVAHQPFDRLGLFRGQAQPRAQPAGDAGAEIGMVAAAALGDVVQHQGDIEAAPFLDLRHDPGRLGQGLGQRPVLQLVQDAQGEQRVLVDREHMVHVVLHLGDDAAEIRDEAAQHPGLVHAPQRRLRVVRAGQDLQEQAVGLRVLAKALVDQVHRAVDDLQRAGVDVEPVVLGHVEQPDHVRPAGLELVLAGQRQAAADDGKAVDRLLAAQEEQPAAAGAMVVLRLQRRADDARQVADGLGVDEVVLHEALDRARAAALAVAHAPADLRLHVEGQPLFRTVGEIVQMATQGAQIGLRLGAAAALRPASGCP